MAKKPETVFKERIRPKLNSLPNSWWEKIQQKSIRATPDFLGTINGIFIAIELKKDEKSDADSLQKHKLRKIKKAGGVALIVSPENWEETYKYLKKLSSLPYKIKRILIDIVNGNIF